MVNRQLYTESVFGFSQTPERITKWPNNGLRHSFGSYHVAHFQNLNMTALQMGHTTTDTLFKHYRNYRIRKKDADAYWELAPAPADKRVVAFAAGRG